MLAFVQQARAARQLALLVSLLSLGLTIPFLVNFVPDASMQFEQRFAWIPALGIHFHIGIDGISLPLVLLTNGLIPLIILSTFSHDYKGGFYALVLFMQ
ncbi:MAG TPA: dehydrogenase, partial [Parapedobacter sp.]|nr:dehydrogenase [Parapedobacter sp.]